MKAIYFFDENKIFTSVDLIELKSTDSKVKLPENSTLVKPEDGLLDPIKFDGKKWIGATQEEHDEYHKNDPFIPGVDPTQPTGDDVVHANLFKQMLSIQLNLNRLLKSDDKVKPALITVSLTQQANDLKDWFIKGLLTENDLNASVECGYITKTEMNEILEA